MILDEAMCHFDEDGVSEVMETIRSIRRHKTTLLISHRASALRYVDRIFSLKQAKIMEENRYRLPEWSCAGAMNRAPTEGV